MGEYTGILELMCGGGAPGDRIYGNFGAYGGGSAGGYVIMREYWRLFVVVAG